MRVQASLQVSSPKDSAEKEAESTAKKVTGMAVPESSVGYLRSGGHGVFRQVKPEEKDKKLQRSFESPYLTRFAASGIFAQKREEKPPLIHRKAEGQPNVSSNVSAEIQNSLAAGAPLPLGVRRFMEPRFRADFSKVKVHTGDKAAKLNRQLSAQAFAVGNDLFFGKDKFQPDTRDGKELIAHELTHTIQQGATVQRREEVNVTQQTPVQVQRLGVSDALDYFADKANLIPGFRMFTIILGVNPINMSAVSRSPANILRAMIEFIPGGALITQALDNYGIFDKIGSWVEQQVKTLGMVGSAIKQSVMDFIHSLSWTDIFDLGGVWNRAKRIFTEPIDRIKAFAVGLATGIIQFIKDAILMPLAKLAEGTRGWDLLVAVLGKNPITGEEVTPTPDLLIGGFMKLIGQEEVWARIKQTNALAKCWAWFQGAVKALLGFVQQIPALAIAAFKSLELVDIVLLPRALMKVAAVFGNFIGNFFTWAGNAVWNLAEIIFDVVKPGALGYVKKTGAALKSILKNPLPFVGNLVRAAKLGFTNFAANFLTHLKNGLIDWLTGSLPGVYIPKAITLLEVGKFALSVLGISWGQIRGKIVKALGPNGEKIMAGLEIAFDVIKALVTGGPAAAWEVIKDKLTDLKDQVIGGITSFIVETVVTKAVPKLIAMFIPGAGFISAIISIYDTVMVFVQKISKIIQVVTAFIDSIVAIAGGAIDAAAARVESILGGLLSLAISFLAGFVGLGKVADKIMGVINKVRTKVDEAIDKAIAWIVSKAKALFAKLFGKEKPDNRTPQEKERDVRAAGAKAEQIANASNHDRKAVAKQLPAIKREFKLTDISMIAAAEGKVTVRAEINPFFVQPLDVADEPELRALLISTGFFGSAPADIDKIVNGVKTDGNGDAVFQFIRSNKYAGVPGYEQVLRQLKNPGMVHSVYMALAQASKVPAGLLGGMKFEETPPGGGDIDLLVLSTTGGWGIAYQFKGVEGLGNISRQANSAANQLRNVAPPVKKVVSIEVRNGTYSDFVASARPALGQLGYMGGILAFQGANPGVTLKVKFSDGTAKTF
ncbi:MAG: hypothetical protein QOD12_850 [Verrucomicrobiota bacterium]